MKTKTRSRKAGKLANPDTPAPRRKRQGGVRGRIIEMLDSGALLAQELLDQGGFSPASLYLNLKALKADGLVDTSREGRSVRYLLTGASAAPVTRSPGKRGRKPGAKAAAAPADDLQSALGVLMTRLAPIDKADEKLLVLSQLARSLPGPVAGILESVIEDLSRLSGKR